LEDPLAMEKAQERADASNLYLQQSCAGSRKPGNEDSCEILERTVEIEKRIQFALDQPDTFDDAPGVIAIQNELFRRFKAKYGDVIDLSDTLTAERVLLFDAIQTGDVETIRSLKHIDWNFVYPPATPPTDSKHNVLEAWCRSPLCLLVRPDEGNLDAKLGGGRTSRKGVSNEDRLALIREVLEAGADPNFPEKYWSCPAAHACFEGDLAALQLLKEFGCKLDQKFEWVLQPEPAFSLMHAAAFNGHPEIISYLGEHLPESAWHELDSGGSNPLHTVMESSRDLETALLLVENGVDGFALNNARRSALSMAIETLPELAKVLLEKKSRFEYRWWGNDLYWFSYDGVVLPTAKETRGAMEVKDADGKRTTIEGLMLRHNRKELMNTPIMLNLLERKWTYFAEAAYQQSIFTFAVMGVGVFLSSVFDYGSPGYLLALGGIFLTYPFYLRTTLSDFAKKRRELAVLDEMDSAEDAGRTNSDYLDFVLNTYTALFVPAVPIIQFVSAGNMSQDLINVAPLAGLLQLTISVRFLQQASLIQSVGPLLLSVYKACVDGARFIGVLSLVVFGFTNAFYCMLHLGITAEDLAGGKHNYSYIGILSELARMLSSPLEGTEYFDVSKISSGPISVFSDLLCGGYILVTSFVCLNLLLAIFYSAYQSVLANSTEEWLFLRLDHCVQTEKSSNFSAKVDEYFSELKQRNTQRAVRDLKKALD
jgi:hypothetical protein